MSKKQFEEWLRMKSEKIQVVNLVLEHMFGDLDGDEKFTTWIFSQIKDNTPEVYLTAGEQKRDFIYIEDVVSAYMICLDNLKKIEKFATFDVGTGIFTSVRSFVESVKEIYENLTGKVVSTKLNFGAIPYREGEIMQPEVDNRKLLALGWKPEVNLRKNITDFIKKELK